MVSFKFLHIYLFRVTLELFRIVLKFSRASSKHISRYFTKPALSETETETETEIKAAMSLTDYFSAAEGLLRSSHYYEEGSLIFDVDYVLTCVPAEVFTAQITGFGEMLTQMRIANPTLGTTEDNALIVERSNPKQFEHFVTYLLHEFTLTDPDLSIEAWKDVLVLSHKYRYWHGRATAVRKLDERPQALNPVSRLTLAIQCGVVEWYHQAVRALLQVSCESWQWYDIETIDKVVFKQILKAQKKMSQSWAVRAVTPPAAVWVTCPFRAQCKVRWEMGWSSVVAPILTSGFKFPVPVDKIVTTIQRDIGTLGICGTCHAAHLLAARQSFEADEEAFDRAVNEVVMYCQRRHIVVANTSGTVVVMQPGEY